MDKISKTMLAVLLSLLLGLLPVQGAFAGFSKFVEDETSSASLAHAMSMAEMQDSHSEMTDCSDCVAGGGCMDNLCASNHACNAGGCASSAMMANQEAIDIVSIPFTVLNLSLSNILPHSPPSSLFRPPIL